MDEISMIREEKKIYSATNAVCSSAAYAIASAVKTNILPYSGGVGSIIMQRMHAGLRKWEEKI